MTATILLWVTMGAGWAPAYASDVPAAHGAAGEGAGAHGEHGAAGEPGAAGEHGAAGEGEHGGGAAGHGGGHHVTYTGDDDGDGIANWMDATTGDQPNTESYVLWSVGFHALNFLLLVGVAFYFVRRPVLDTFRTRALGIRTELTEAHRKRDEAYQRQQEVLARLERIETEVRALEAEAEADAQREAVKLEERAQREADRIREQAQRNIRDEVRRARTELRAEAVDLAVQLARATLAEGVTKKDQQALAREFLTSIRGGDRV